jgi:hypothetical protein
MDYLHNVDVQVILLCPKICSTNTHAMKWIGPIDFLEKRSTYKLQQLPLDPFLVDVTDIDVGWYMFNTPLP